MFLFNGLSSYISNFPAWKALLYFAGDTARILSVPRIDSSDWFLEEDPERSLQHDNNLPSCKISMSESCRIAHSLVVSVGVCSIRENASLSHICRRLHYLVMHNSVGTSHSTSLFHRFLRVSPRSQAAVNLRIPGDRQGLGRVGTIDRNGPL